MRCFLPQKWSFSPHLVAQTTDTPSLWTVVAYKLWTDKFAWYCGPSIEKQVNCISLPPHCLQNGWLRCLTQLSGWSQALSVMIALGWHKQWNSLSLFSLMFLLRFGLCKGWSLGGWSKCRRNNRGTLKWRSRIGAVSLVEHKVGPIMQARYLVVFNQVTFFFFPRPLIHSVQRICCKNRSRLLPLRSFYLWDLVCWICKWFKNVWKSARRQKRIS